MIDTAEQTTENPGAATSTWPTLATLVGSWLPALAAFAWALTVAVTGGFVVTLAGVRISSHRIVPPYLLGVMFLFLSSRNRSLFRRLGQWKPPAWASALVAFAIVASTLAVAVRFGAFTAVGDAFGYVAQADAWRRGQLFGSQGPVLAMPWWDAAYAFCPLGFRPGAISGTMVPTYAPGLPLLMAAFRTLAGPNGVYLVVPLSGALAVACTFRLGRLWMDRTTGIVASAVVAASPVFLFQLVQPMSDVPVTAFLLLAIVAACDRTWMGAIGSGVAASIALLIRPNLAPLALPLGAWVFVWPALAGVMSRVGRLLLFGVALAPLCLLVAWVQFTLYGSPFASGYGRAADIYALANLLPNLARYPRWLLQTHTPFLLLALLSPFVGRFAGGVAPPPEARKFAWLALAFAASLFACYALYIPFDHWTYLRFLLPALPLLLTLSAGTLVVLARRWRTWGPLAIGLCSVLLVLLYVQAAVRGDAFALRSAYQARFQEVGRFVDAQTPRNAAFIGLVQTSSLTYYGHRQTLRYDLIAPAEFDRAVAELRRAGYKPYLMLMAEEENDFRGRIAGKSAVGALRCGPRQTFAGGEVRMYDVGDCERR